MNVYVFYTLVLTTIISIGSFWIYWSLRKFRAFGDRLYPETSRTMYKRLFIVLGQSFLMILIGMVLLVGLLSYMGKIQTTRKLIGTLVQFFISASFSIFGGIYRVFHGPFIIFSKGIWNGYSFYPWNELQDFNFTLNKENRKKTTLNIRWKNRDEDFISLKNDRVTRVKTIMEQEMPAT